MTENTIEIREENVIALRKEGVIVILPFDRNFLINKADGTQVALETFEQFETLLSASNNS